MPGWVPNAVGDDDNGGKGSKDGEEKGFCRQTDRRKDSERDTGITDIRNVEEPVYNRCRFVQIKSALNPGFGPTIQNQRGEDQKEVW